MNIVISILLLYAFGSISGWILELVYRRFFSSHRWINHGILIGPYLPLYGFGLSLLFVISYFIDFTKWVDIPSYLNVILVILIMCIVMTLIEYIAGIIFIKGMGIKLWDYSDRWGNIQGIICPLFSLFWSIIAVAFYFLLKDPCASLVIWFESKIETNIYTMFILGVFYGMMLVDFCYSMHIATKIKEFAVTNKITIKYEKIKESIRDFEIKSKKRINYIFPLKSDVPLKEHLLKQLNSFKDKIDRKDQ